MQYKKELMEFYSLVDIEYILQLYIDRDYLYSSLYYYELWAEMKNIAMKEQQLPKLKLFVSIYKQLNLTHLLKGNIYSYDTIPIITQNTNQITRTLQLYDISIM